MYNAPLLPLVDIPELKITWPLDVKSELFKIRPPLTALEDPEPLISIRRPPTPPLEIPDCNISSPPEPLFPEPTVI